MFKEVSVAGTEAGSLVQGQKDQNFGTQGKTLRPHSHLLIWDHWQNRCSSNCDPKLSGDHCTMYKMSLGVIIP